mgnify:CR=1 FL=1
MATKIPVPRLGQSEETVTIQSWKVKEGDVIKKGDVLFDVETDKAVLDVESQFEGTVLKILVPAGKEVPVLCTGLIVGIPAYFGYNYLVARIEKLVFQMEANSIAFMDILNQPVQK